MRLTLVSFHLYLPSCHSLKDKRRVLQGLKTRIRNRLNVSVAEVEGHETWQRSTLAIAWVSTDGGGIDKTIAALDKLIEARGELQVIDMQRFDY